MPKRSRSILPPAAMILAALLASVPLAAEPPHAHPPELTPEAVRAIERGTRWLVSAQNPDGSWRTRGPSGSYPTAMTALAGLALLAGGSTPDRGPHAENVSAALTYLLKTARRDGLIAQLEEESHCMHGHGFALLFLAECYGMEEDPVRMGELRLVLQRAVELTARSQSSAGGWLYTPDARADEGSVTVTQVQGLRACRNAGIAVPKRTIDRAMAYLVGSANPDGGIRYQISDAGPSRPAITAAAVACFFNAGEYEHPFALSALDYVRRELSPARGQHSRYFGHYFYAHVYMSQVMYLRGDEEWLPYIRTMQRELLDRQEPDGSWMGDHVGPVYGTSSALMILQLPYKNLPILQR